MRGKGKRYNLGRFDHRITPAYAGKRRQIDRKEKPQEDHPRLCGEKAFTDNFVLVLEGSPPPMRGKAVKSHRVCQEVWITPAYAGKRLISPISAPPRQDHPRLCGEKPVVKRHFIVVFRITPAYAGKRVYRAKVKAFDEDHPRLCGEKQTYLLQEGMQIGSPPPMRGKGLIHLIVNHLQRITPAYAGKSRFR